MPPLTDIRILDLTRLLPGGMTTWLLATLGAHVIKIESPDGGDPARSAPPLIDGMGAAFHATNRGKRSLVLNLKHDLGSVVLRRLVERADVLIENFRPGVMERLGVGYAALRAVNPRLIYCSLSGWGASGAYAEYAGHDLNYTAAAGVIGGMEAPQPLGAQVSDIGAAYLATAAISAALYARSVSGVGDQIELSLYGAAIPFGALAFSEAVGKTTTPNRLTGALACYRVYKARDGRALALGALEPRFWTNFCNAINRPDLIPDHDAPDRQPYLIAELTGIFAAQTAAEWAALLVPADCCFSLAPTPDALLDDPLLQSRAALSVAADGTPQIASPFAFLSNATPALGTSPRFGQHSRTILREIGYSDEAIAMLIQSHVVLVGSD